jgi:hypothetical protein
MQAVHSRLFSQICRGNEPLKSRPAANMFAAASRPCIGGLREYKKPGSNPASIFEGCDHHGL